MQVSLIIPTLNEATNIATAVERAWQAGADEVIVVDGDSADGTLDIAQGLNCVTLHAPRGRAGQMNRGAKHACHDVVLFLHADTHLARDAVEQIRKALRNPRLVAGAFRQIIDAQGAKFRLLERGNAFRARCGRPYGDQGIFVRREVFQAIGGFPKVRLLEDVLLMRKLRAIGRTVLLPGPLHVSARRWLENGVIRQTLRNWRILAAERLGADPDRLAKDYPPHRGLT